MDEVTLISPYGEKLVDLVVPTVDRDELFSYASGLRSIQMTRRETCDLELLATGAFSPLRGFMSKADHDRVVAEGRLASGTLFPIPLSVSTDDAADLAIGDDIGLRDPKNELLAVMTVEEIFEWDREKMALLVFGTADPRHPLVAEIQGWGRFNLSGKLRVLKLPEYHDFRDLRLTPRQTRKALASLGRDRVVAFQTRNPIHHAHEAMIRKAMDISDGTLLLHPVVGMAKEGDIDHFTRVRTYTAFRDTALPAGRALLGLLPLGMRMAGPREAVWHAIIRRNYGASHFIVGRDHASPGLDRDGRAFYHPSAAQELAIEMSDEIGVKILAFNEFVYLPQERRYEEIAKVTPGRKTYSLSGSRLREDLADGREIPGWFARRDVAKILSESYPPRHRQGVCLWFTGLSGSGKSTTAETLASLLLEEGRQSSLLDGDVVRTHLSKGLGFSREDRDINIRRIGFVASEIVRHGGVAICAAVSPYRQTRNEVRSMFGSDNFIEIFVDTPLEVCEQRDTKGMYARARRGEISDFTGIDDVYEEPQNAEIKLDTVHNTARENSRYIVEFLRSKRLIRNRTRGASR